MHDIVIDELETHLSGAGVSKPASNAWTVRPLTSLMARERTPGGSVPLP